MNVCVVVGAGAQGRVTLEAWRTSRPDARFLFVDDNAALHGTSILGAEVVGGLDRLADLGARVVVALGNNETRLAIAARLEGKVEWGTVVSASATVLPSATIGPGTVVLAGAIINTEARIGAHAVINTGVIVEHDCIIEDGSSLSPGTRMGGRVHVGRGAFVSTGVTLSPRVKIGEGAIIGAGSVVMRDIPARVLAYGVPARVIGPVEPAFDWKRLL